MAIKVNTEVIGSFEGIDLKAKARSSGSLAVAMDVDIDSEGQIQKAKKVDLLEAGNFHSIFEWCGYLYVVKNNTLIEYYSGVVLQTNVHSKLRYAGVGGDVIYTSRNISGVISGLTRRDYGIPLAPAPLVSLLPGSLNSGTYQVVVTFVIDGREGSSTSTSSVVLGEDKSIFLPTLPKVFGKGVTHYRIYSTLSDGKTLYLIDEIPYSEASYSIISVDKSSVEYDKVNLMPPPLGDFIAYQRGRVFISVDDILYISKYHMYEHFEYNRDYIYFDKNITAILPVQDGVWVSGGGLHYVNKDLSAASLKEHAQVVPDSGQLIEGADVLIEGAPAGFKWLCTTDKGIFCLFNAGFVINLTDAKIELESGVSSASIVTREDGIDRYIVNMKTDGIPIEKAAMNDFATATVIRNGVVIDE